MTDLFYVINKSEKKRLRQQAYRRDNYTCVYCRRNMKEQYFAQKSGKKTEKGQNCITVDHVKPKSSFERDEKGTRIESWSMENLVTSCFECNVKKGNNLLK